MEETRSRRLPIAERLREFALQLEKIRGMAKSA